jgi:hypothetical protein
MCLEGAYEDVTTTVDGEEVTTSEYVCSLDVGTYYSDAYDCATGAYSVEYEFCYCPAAYAVYADDTGLYESCNLATYYCHGEIVEGECVETCETWYTSDDDSGVCYCHADYLVAEVVEADVVTTPRSCDYAATITKLEGLCGADIEGTGYGAGFWEPAGDTYACACPT